jgi:hypothetical protein
MTANHKQQWPFFKCFYSFSIVIRSSTWATHGDSTATHGDDDAAAALVALSTMHVEDDAAQSLAALSMAVDIDDDDACKRSTFAEAADDRLNK